MSYIDPGSDRCIMNIRKKIKFYFIFLVIFLQIPFLYGQDSIVKNIAYDIISINSFRSSFVNQGLLIEKPDSIQRSRHENGTLTDLFVQNGLFFIKSYGCGNLATTSFRGASASQTPLLWNGFNLQSPTNGTVDLSLVPAILCDVISIQNGGGSAGWGSGSIGGLIQANNIELFDEGLKLKYIGTIGSFGELQNAIQICSGNSRLYSDVRIYSQQSKNNFTYRNLGIANFPIDTIENSCFNQKGTQLQVGWRSKNYKHSFVLRAWYQTTDREIPPSMLEVNNLANQHDEFFRSMGSWKMSYSKFSFEFKTAMLTEFMDFYQGFQFPKSQTHSISFINDVIIKIPLTKKISTNFGVVSTFSKAEVTQFVPLTTQNRLSAFNAIQFIPNEQLNFVLNFRAEEVEGKLLPFVGSLASEWSPNKFATLKSSLSRNYRIPTFNDLYWQPGGNINLKPEDSWNAEGSLVFKLQKKHFFINYSFTAYYRQTKNWIQWRPTVGNSTIWSPENLLEVWSKGLEHHLQTDWYFNKFKINLNFAYNYVRATNENSIVLNDVSLGKQLVYVPTHYTYSMLQLTYRNFYLSYAHQFNGLRFTASDHSTYLPAYDLATVTIGKRVDYKIYYFDVFFRTVNLFNEEYQAMSWRPMPGRNYHFGLTLNFNKPNL
jgi:vitamin B12 transporter